MLAQSSAAMDGWLPLAVFAVVLFILALVMYERERRRRMEIESHLRVLASSQNREDAGEDRQRNEVLFAQHRAMNDLQITKLTAEVELLQSQVRERPVEHDRIEAAKEYHELMVEKTKLEIDTLRLQVAEMRRRYEDWRSDPES